MTQPDDTTHVGDAIRQRAHLVQVLKMKREDKDTIEMDLLPRGTWGILTAAHAVDQAAHQEQLRRAREQAWEDGYQAKREDVLSYGGYQVTPNPHRRQE